MHRPYTHQQLANIDLEVLAQELPYFAFSSSVRDLGVTLDEELTFKQHISLLSHHCYNQLPQLKVV